MPGRTPPRQPGVRGKGTEVLREAPYECTSRRTVAIGMKSVSGSVGVGSKPKRA